MERLGIDPDFDHRRARRRNAASIRTSATTACTRIGPDGRYDPRLPRYNGYLNDKGYPGDNPWHDFANAAEGEGNTLASGWAMRHARKPARIREEDSETPYMTRARDGLHAGGRRRSRGACICPTSSRTGPISRRAPYHDMYGPDDVIPAVRAEAEREDPHPVYREFMDHRVSSAFSRDEVRDEVIPVYMGLIKQIDDQLGVLFGFMQERGLLDNTMIVFTSDHGDYLGDHWLGEKELFHEPSVKVPLIIYDPSAAADAARGTVCDELVESIDLVPTFLEAVGADPAEQAHRLEGRSLVPLLRGAPTGGVAALRDQRIRLFDAAGGRKLSASRRAMRACSWWPTSAGNTCTRSASGRCCSIWPAIRTSSAISAPIRPMRPSASGWRPHWRNGACGCRSAPRCRTRRSAACAASRSGAAS